MTTRNTYEAGESLMDMKELLERLCMSRSTFYEHEADLKARGLQEVRASDKRRRFRRKSVDRLIVSAAEREEPLW
jgi:predicted DNA-binding transcriptional regulator AlpA